jgi:multimeric flavodoxin WrbA/putative sterol carrier protein
MKVLALNSSARVGKGSITELMLDHLVQGMREAGAEVEVVNLEDKKIKTCIGCFTCWTKTPGVCVLQDDMTKELFPKWVESDLCVYGTPLFIHTVNATLKRFLERMLPVLEPFFEDRDGRWHHPIRHQPPRAVVLSVAGFPADSAFTALKDYVRFLWGDLDALVGEIYRHSSHAIVQKPDLRDDILAATVQAGREIIQQGKIEPETLARITQPVVEPEQFMHLGNMFWKTCIDQGITPAEFEEKGLLPQPRTMDELLVMLSMGFNPQAADGLTAVIQFDFSGEVDGSCHMAIGDGRMETAAEAASKPDLTIAVAFEDWCGIMAGRLDPQQLVMDGRMKPVGDLSLMMQFPKMFGHQH